MCHAVMLNRRGREWAPRPRRFTHNAIVRTSPDCICYCVTLACDPLDRVPFREEQRDGDPRSACREDSESPATRRGNSLHCKAAFHYPPTNRTTQGERWPARHHADGRRRTDVQLWASPDDGGEDVTGCARAPAGTRRHARIRLLTTACIDMATTYCALKAPVPVTRGLTRTLETASRWSKNHHAAVTI